MSSSDILIRSSRSYSWFDQELRPGRCFTRSVCGYAPVPVRVLGRRDDEIQLEEIYTDCGTNYVIQSSKHLTYLAVDEWWEPLEDLAYLTQLLA